MTAYDFFDALARGNFPAVSFLKAPGYQDGHAGYSSPLDEQTFVVNTINALQKNPDWKSTAVIIAWDDSDGWYDHQMGPIVIQSNTAEDALAGAGSCGTAKAGAYEGRCGYGPRLGDFTFRQEELRRSQCDRPELRPPFHRG